MGVVVAAEEVHVPIATSASQSNVIESSTNVRYANYQSLSQMTDYLNGNGNSDLISAIIGKIRISESTPSNNGRD